MNNVQSAISSIIKLAEELDYIKRRIQNNQNYYIVSIAEAKSEQEKLILLGAYLATKQLMQATQQPGCNAGCSIDAALFEVAKLELHFGHNNQM